MKKDMAVDKPMSAKEWNKQRCDYCNGEGILRDEGDGTPCAPFQCVCQSGMSCEDADAFAAYRVRAFAERAAQVADRDYINDEPYNIPEHIRALAGKE